MALLKPHDRVVIGEVEEAEDVRGIVTVQNAVVGEEQRCGDDEEGTVIPARLRVHIILSVIRVKGHDECEGLVVVIPSQEGHVAIQLAFLELQVDGMELRENAIEVVVVVNAIAVVDGVADGVESHGLIEDVD